jgi:hypothetical protein
MTGKIRIRESKANDFGGFAERITHTKVQTGLRNFRLEGATDRRG